MNAPYFTSPDKGLLRGESTRDPLGLMPIWSGLGHQLIPGLATTVSRIDGIQGILFLYTCLNGLSPEIRSRMVDDKILRLLERLWEYHLYKYREKRPCFGVTSLNAVDFQLNFKGEGTVSTGLRQYYRGTCKNKGILADDLKTLKQPWQGICERLLKPKLIAWLETQIQQGAAEIYTVSASAAYEKLNESLELFSAGNPELWKEIEGALITDAQQKRWIEHVVKNVGNWNDDVRSTRDLALSIQDYAKSQQDCEKWVGMCQDILYCEPFLQVLESAFSVLQESGRTTLDALAKSLSMSAPYNLVQVCKHFSSIKFSSKRFEGLRAMAGKLQNKDYRGFVIELLSVYYPMVCKDRGKSPSVHLDGETVISVSPRGGGTDWGKSSLNWNNGYFIQTQISLYMDLQSCKSRMGVAHG